MYKCINVLCYKSVVSIPPHQQLVTDMKQSQQLANFKTIKPRPTFFFLFEKLFHSDTVCQNREDKNLFFILTFMLKAFLAL